MDANRRGNHGLFSFLFLLEAMFSYSYGYVNESQGHHSPPPEKSNWGPSECLSSHPVTKVRASAESDDDELGSSPEVAIGRMENGGKDTREQQ